ncbi:MAG: bifunctional phosphopantothenoylcysteine decarboxylase/phosphopantothenate--cysteine ligase CoaBC [Bacteroidia bacterium]|jgi:phosphopantothenoylcysteine decarboxylase/phosphopantothenate--cysteine ligase
MLKHKRILIGISGGIAAYKVPFLVRLLVKAGAEVRVMMTPKAHEFVSAEVLAVFTNHPVISEFYTQNGMWNNHVHWAEWAELIVIVPATLNTMGALAQGSCTRFLDAVYFSSKCPVILCPAMDLEMYQSQALQLHVQQLKTRSNLIVIEPESGLLASGLEGQGRLPEPDIIFKHIKDYIAQQLPLYTKKVLISAGPTHEYIDPVRFIGNASSGRMGIALAEAFSTLGAHVQLVLGPTTLTTSYTSIDICRVISAEDMLVAMQQRFKDQDLVIAAAAVADYRPKIKHHHKLKKNTDLSLELIANPDILKTLSALKSQQCLVGFALETQHLQEHALQKLKSKGLDYIIANWASEAIGTTRSRAWIINKHNNTTEISFAKKDELARQIAQFFITVLK